MGANAGLLTNEEGAQLEELISSTQAILEIHDTEPPQKRRKMTGEDIATVSSHPAPLLREQAAENLRKQAEKMVARGKGILPPIQVGDNVLVPIPAVDRGRGDPTNLVAVVLEMKEEKVRVGTRDGVLNTWFERNQVAATRFKSISIDDIRSEDVYSLRELVRLGSVGTGQGYRRCSCRGDCDSKRCKCQKDEMICNSACHPGRTCKNI